jgi:putative ABC transport system permease protein
LVVFGIAMNLFAEMREGLGISWDAIRANKMRSVLTTLGIVIGIVTVTLMGTAIEGLNRAFMKSISTLGADVFYVQRFNWINTSESDWLRGQKRRPIKLVDAQAVARQLTLAAAVAPSVDTMGPVKYKNRSASSVFIVGTTEEYQNTTGVGVIQGRFLSPADAAGGRPVCVIGTEVATNLFQSAPPLGNRIKIGPQSYEVIGVLEKQGSFMGMFSLDNRVIIPLQHFMNTFWNNPDIEIQVKAGCSWTKPARNCAMSCAGSGAWRRVNQTTLPSTNRTSSWRCSTRWRGRLRASDCSSPACRSSSAASAS